MSTSNTPKDGDFASLLEQASAKPGQPRTSVEADEAIEDVDAALEAFEEAADLEGVPPLSDEELERQALADGGADNDTSTPE